MEEITTTLSFNFKILNNNSIIIHMEDKSKHNLNQFIKKLQYHGAIQRMNDATERYNEKVSLNDLNMKLPCGAYITSMILLTDTEDNIKAIACRGTNLSSLQKEVWLSNLFMGLPVRISGTDFDSLYQLIIFATLT